MTIQVLDKDDNAQTISTIDDLIEFIGLASTHVAVTLSDDVDDPNGPFNKGLMLASDGDVVCSDSNGTEITYTGLKAGMIIDVQITRVGTATTATVVGRVR